MGCEEEEVRASAGKVSRGQILQGLVKQVGKFGPCPWSNGEASVNFRKSHLIIFACYVSFIFMNQIMIIYTID